MAGRGFFYDLSDELENNANVHRSLVSAIEKKTGRTLVCYFANPGHPAAALEDGDPDLLENLLRSLDLDVFERRLDLLIASPGGFPYAAGKIVKVCRTYAKDFRAVVLNRAMSAATLVCLGAHELLMTDTASLGPIDPQMVRGAPQGPQRLVPASVIISSFRDILGACQQAVAAGQPADPFLHVLDSLDVTAVFESMKAIESTKLIAAELLKEGLLRSDTGRIDGVVQSLIAEGQNELHGKHLYPAILSDPKIGLPVTVIARGSPADVLFAKLDARMRVYANTKRVAKYWLSRKGGFDVQVVRAKI